MSEETNTNTPINPEVIDERELIRPGVPVSAEDLALLEEGRGEKIILARAQILATARGASIRATFPNDWTLFRTDQNQIYGFLGDQGCERCNDIWGIRLSNFGPRPINPFWEKREGKTEEEYSIRLVADAYCELTRQTYLQMEGFGYSDDQDAQQVSAAQKREDRVANHSRRNLAGRVMRRAGGLEAVPIEEIQKQWEGTTKSVERCNLGRGFGSKDERLGGAGAQGIDQADIPMCDLCQIKLVYRPGKGDRGAFWGCPQWDKHKETKVIIPHEKLLRQIEDRKKKVGREAGEES